MEPASRIQHNPLRSRKKRRAMGPYRKALSKTKCTGCGVAVDRCNTTDDLSCAGRAVQRVQASDGDDKIRKLKHLMDPLLLSARRRTFQAWPHEGKEGWKCSADDMAAAGWSYTPQKWLTDGTTCHYCGLFMYDWEPDDDSMQTHTRQKPNCPFFALLAANKRLESFPNEKLTWKSLEPRRLDVLMTTLPCELWLRILYWFSSPGGVIEPAKPYGEAPREEVIRDQGKAELVPNPIAPLLVETSNQLQEKAIEQFGKATDWHLEHSTTTAAVFCTEVLFLNNVINPGSPEPITSPRSPSSIACADELGSPSREDYSSNNL